MIDIIFLTNLLTGAAVSTLFFVIVEVLIRTMKIHDHRQRSNLYLLALFSSFSSIAYTFHPLGIHWNGDKLVLTLPNIVSLPRNMFMMGFINARGFRGFDLRIIFFVLIVVSLSLFLSIIFFSTYYMKKRFNLKKCKDKEIVELMKKICCESNVNMPKIMVAEGINAFVFGVPPVLVIGKELLERTTEKELELILKHEVNHIKNHDNIIKPFIFSMRILFFFNPVVHILSQNLTSEREFLADRVSEIKKEKVLFLYALLKLNEAHIGKKNIIPSAVSFTLIRSNLKVRTDKLLREEKRTGFHPWIVSFWIFAILIIGGMYVSSNFVAPKGGPPLDDSVLPIKAPEKMFGVPPPQLGGPHPDQATMDGVCSIMGDMRSAVIPMAGMEHGPFHEGPGHCILRNPVPVLFYSINTTMFMAILAFPLLFEVPYYVVRHKRL
jgi:beta-lactamase regulating signal transducer with metallopeptidase domain